MIGGNFNVINQTSYSACARLNSDGSLDSSYQSGFLQLSINEPIISFSKSGKTIICNPSAGNPEDSLTKYKVQLLETSGELDTSFYLKQIIDPDDQDQVGSFDGIMTIYAAGFSVDEKPIIAYDFIGFKEPTPVMHQYNLDGTLDTTNFTSIFPDLYSGPSPTYVSDFTVQKDGKIYSYDNYVYYGYGTSYSTSISAHNNNGELDSSFNKMWSDFSEITAIGKLEDSTVIFSGSFNMFNSYGYSIIYSEIDAAGKIDTTTIFPPEQMQINNSGPSRVLIEQEDGKILCFGGFKVGARNNILRLIKQKNIVQSVSALDELNLIRIYPNPIIDQLTVELLQPELTQIILYNGTGQVVTNLTSKGNRTVNIDFSTKPKGFYFCNIISASGTKSFKVVKN